MNARNVAQVIRPAPVLEGAGVRLHRSFPSNVIDHVDPFLLFDDFSSRDPDDFARGFPWHPHRGIETVTYVLEGVVHHRDSLNNAGSIGTGEAQWMTAGSGIMHEEMPDPRRAPLLGFQLWVNLPARRKLTTPRYQSIASSAIPAVPLEGGGTVRVIAGTAGGARGPVTEISVEPTYLDVELPPDGAISHPAPADAGVLAYLFVGSAAFDGSGDRASLVSARGMVVFTDGDRVEVRAGDHGARYLFFAGRRLREPIARHGPFVMNTREEIQEALRDLREGTFIRSRPAGAPDTGGHETRRTTCNGPSAAS
jgi:hypothetical protein